MSTESLYQQFYTEPFIFPESPVTLPEAARVPDSVAIEGNVGAGKTTVTDMVASQTGLAHIGEYGNYVNFVGGEDFPKFPPKDISEVIRTNTIWTQLEFRRRAHQLSVQPQLTNKIQLIERSPVSLIAFEYAKMKQGIPSEIDHLLGVYSKMYDVGILREPKGYVFIQVSPEVIQGRIKRKANNPTLEFLCRNETVMAINEFMRRFFVEYINPGNFIILESDDAKLNWLASEIIGFIDRLKRNPQTTNGIVRLAQDALTGKLTA